ncbi:MAG: hypothetical protein AB7N76_30390 [Planctomycetota bacterium]
MSRLLGAVLAMTVAAPAFGQSAESRREAIWKEVSKTPYTTLPAPGSAGFPFKAKDTLQTLNKKVLRRSFDLNQDQREQRTKLFHAFGTVAKVVFEPAKPSVGAEGKVREVQGQQQGLDQAQPRASGPVHPYTGLLREGAVGLIRLSLASDEKRYIPGVALKLIPAGTAPTANILAIPGFGGQQSRDFFAQAPTNIIPGLDGVSGWFSKVTLNVFIWIQKRAAPQPLWLKVAPAAAVHRDGSQVKDPKAPFQVVFRPADVHIPTDAQGDFRELIAKHVPKGSVIYRVYGRDQDGEERLLGTVRTESEFVASEYGDREFHFVHTEFVVGKQGEAAKGAAKPADEK